MPKKRLAFIGISTIVLYLGLLIAAGCGGGGPLNSSNIPVTAVAQFTQLLPAAQKSATRVGATQCAKCHATDHTSWLTTRHSAMKVDCESCHGPGSAHAAAPTLTNILRGVDSTNSAVCGQCHNDINNDWSASKHAGIVEDPVNLGNNNCFRCHSGEFRALNVDSPLSRGQTPAQINTAILALDTPTLQSFIPVTHSSATCVNCHDPHANTANLTSEGEQFYLRRATSSTDLSSDPPGATATNYTTLNHICGSCHNNRGGDPSDAGLTRNTTRPATHEGPEYNMLLGAGGAEDSAGPPIRRATHSEAPDQCVKCHMPNSRHTFTVSLDTSCAPCHTPSDAASRASSVQGEVQNGLVALRTRLQNWAQTTFHDPNVWEYTSNIPATSTKPDQSLVPLEVKRARHNYYFILLDRSLGVHNTPYTRYLLNYANTGLDTIGVSRAATRSLDRRSALAILNEDIARVRASNIKLGNL